jgi:hypothetical protein
MAAFTISDAVDPAAERPRETLKKRQDRIYGSRKKVAICLD